MTMHTSTTTALRSNALAGAGMLFSDVGVNCQHALPAASIGLTKPPLNPAATSSHRIRMHCMLPLQQTYTRYAHADFHTHHSSASL